MKRAASRMSTRSPNVSGCIEKLAGLVDRLEKILLTYSPGHDEIYLAPEQVRQRLLKCEIARCPRPKFVVWWVLNEEVDVASFRIELSRADRAEDLQPGNAKFPAQGADRLQVLGNDRIVEAVPLTRGGHNGHIGHSAMPLTCVGAHARSRISTVQFEAREHRSGKVLADARRCGSARGGGGQSRLTARRAWRRPGDAPGAIGRGAASARTSNAT